MHLKFTLDNDLGTVAKKSTNLCLTLGGTIWLENLIGKISSLKLRENETMTETMKWEEVSKGNRSVLPLKFYIPFFGTLTEKLETNSIYL